jgi:hypothetical protein
MALSDMFASSIAGINSGFALLDASARAVANPAAWGGTLPPAASVSAFQEILTEKVANLTQSGANRPGGDQTGKDQGGGIIQPPVVTPLAVTTPDLVPLPGPNLVDAMMDMLIAEKLIEANARLISTQSKAMGTLLRLGE